MAWFFPEKILKNGVDIRAPKSGKNSSRHGAFFLIFFFFFFSAQPHS